MQVKPPLTFGCMCLSHHLVLLADWLLPLHHAACGLPVLDLIWCVKNFRISVYITHNVLIGQVFEIFNCYNFKLWSFCVEFHSRLTYPICIILCKHCSYHTYKKTPYLQRYVSLLALKWEQITRQHVRLPSAWREMLRVNVLMGNYTKQPHNLKADVHPWDSAQLWSTNTAWMVVSSQHPRGIFHSDQYCKKRHHFYFLLFNLELSAHCWKFISCNLHDSRNLGSLQCHRIIEWPVSPEFSWLSVLFLLALFVTGCWMFCSPGMREE